MFILRSTALTNVPGLRESLDKQSAMRIILLRLYISHTLPLIKSCTSTYLHDKNTI